MIPSHSRVISLERTPNRLQAFQARTRNIVPEVMLHPGTDGNSLDLEALSFKGFLDTKAKFWPRGQIGCALSHINVWQECRRIGEPFLVFEDDVLLSNNFRSCLSSLMLSLPESWEFCLLGWNHDSCLQWEWGSGCSCTALFQPRYPDQERLQLALNESFEPKFYRLISALGLAGYVISPSGASRLLEWVFPLRSIPINIPELPVRECFSLDGQLNSLYFNFNAFVCIPPIAIGANDQDQSLTQS